ncbi:MAG: hypothetical protein WC765_03925 [Phycisphaerae bacterium]|nr:MAG: hypothetical protein A2Y13_08220 [Planctomycetes bacterium GWC2_45_44]HBG77306.1 hypothetical protein [Phycisphaerales bacterium]HBR20653.1 hypothetical protein [Phycisphaerales bacterium]
MGWRTKFIFLLVIYFAGFATAIYYLAPDGRQDSNGAVSFSDQSSSGGAFSGLYDKVSAKAQASFPGMDSKEFKEKFNLGMQKLMEMSKNSKTANNSSQ